MSNRIDEKEVMCVICPNSCRMKVWEDPDTEEIMVEGNKCPRGKTYGVQEYKNPTRMLITTMRILGASHPVIPIHSKGEIPKSMIFNAMRVVNDSYCKAPVKMDDVLIEDLLDTGIDVVASRDMDKVKEISDNPESEIGEKITSLLMKEFVEGDPEEHQEIMSKIDKIKSELLSTIKKKYS